MSHQHSLEGPESEVVVWLGRELLLTQVEEQHDLACQLLRTLHALAEEHHLHTHATRPTFTLPHHDHTHASHKDPRAPD